MLQPGARITSPGQAVGAGGTFDSVGIRTTQCLVRWRPRGIFSRDCNRWDGRNGLTYCYVRRARARAKNNAKYAQEPNDESPACLRVKSPRLQKSFRWKLYIKGSSSGKSSRPCLSRQPSVVATSPDTHSRQPQKVSGWRAYFCGVGFTCFSAILPTTGSLNILP
jgi:hypothetical protein